MKLPEVTGKLSGRKLAIVPLKADGATHKRDAVFAPKDHGKLLSLKSRTTYCNETKALNGLLAWYHDEVAKDSASTLDNDDDEVDSAVKDTQLKVERIIATVAQTSERLEKVLGRAVDACL